MGREARGREARTLAAPFAPAVGIRKIEAMQDGDRDADRGFFGEADGYEARTLATKNQLGAAIRAWR